MNKLHIACFIVGFVAFEHAIANAFPIPNQNQHSAFQINSWQPNQPNVILFVDPLCTYCKKIIPKLDRIKDYNLYVFWAPVFGEKSEKSIQPYFQCDKPTSRRLLDSIIDSHQPTAPCSGNYNETLRSANDVMVGGYDINYVPAFYLQGRRVSFTDIASKTNTTTPQPVNGVNVDWRRYKASGLDQDQKSEYQAIIIPASSNTPVDLLIEKYQPNYIFLDQKFIQRCDGITDNNGCSILTTYLFNSGLYFIEIMALLDLKDQVVAPYLINKAGKVITAEME